MANKDYFYDTCTCGGRKQKRANVCATCAWGRGATVATTAASVAVPEKSVDTDRAVQKSRAELTSLKRRYDESLRTIERQEKELGTVAALNSGLERFVIEARKGTGRSEATPVLVASDWHVEENVSPNTIDGLNEYNMKIAKSRSETCAVTLAAACREVAP